MKTLFKKIIGSSFLIGMASVFCPSVIDVEPMKYNKNDDSRNIADDWKQLGSYMTKAYETFRK